MASSILNLFQSSSVVGTIDLMVVGAVVIEAVIFALSWYYEPKVARLVDREAFEAKLGWDPCDFPNRFNVERNNGSSARIAHIGLVR